MGFPYKFPFKFYVKSPSNTGLRANFTKKLKSIKRSKHFGVH